MYITVITHVRKPWIIFLITGMKVNDSLTEFLKYQGIPGTNPSLSLSLSMDPQPFGPWPLFRFLNPIRRR
jgi:hypothetical protein